MERAEEIYKRIGEEGAKAIDDFIAARASEELFLDFKRSSDDGSGKRLSQIDRNNLAKAISGFGNSEGGVIIWGVDCSKDVDGADVAKARFPITDVARYVSWLNSAVSGCTIPPHSGVRSEAIPADSEGNGFVRTLIPKSNNAPHQMVGKLQYYIRAGSDFVPTPHGVLAGMFGRRPQPNVFQKFTVTPAEAVGNEIHFEAGFLIRNEGPGIASDLFVSAIIDSGIGENCRVGVQTPDLNNWTAMWSFGRHLSIISKPEVRLPPEAHFQPAILAIDIMPPITRAFKMEGIVGCSNAPPSRFIMETSADDIQRLYDGFMEKHREGTLTEQDGHEFTEAIVKVQPEPSP